MLAIKNLAIEIRKRLVHIFLLGGWALILYNFGRPFDALFIIAFYLLLVLARPRPFILVAACVLVIVLFNSPVVDTWTRLKESNLSIYHHVPPALAKIFRPNSGQEILPGQVQHMLPLLQIHQISSYQLSTLFEQDGWIMQRMIEAAWPIKMESTSPYLFISPEEIPNYPNCDVIDQREDVALGYCH